MVSVTIIRQVLGFGLKGIGFFWAIFDKFLCQNVCRNNCSALGENSCSLLFLFVGIIFIICGYALIIMKDKKRRKLKTKIKSAIKSVKI